MVEIKKGTAEVMSDITDQTKRWKIGFLDKGHFMEIEGDHLFTVIRLFYRARRSYNRDWLRRL
jgi:hypothetical protein